MVGPVLVLVLVLFGCLACSSGSGDVPDPTPVTGPAVTSSPALTSPALPSPSAAPSLPAVKLWSAGKGELHPEVKEAATAYIEAAGSWHDGEGSASAVAKRVRALGLSREAAKDAARMADDDAAVATLDVIYPQFGGLTSTSASVMLLAEQTLLGPDGETDTRAMIFDIRLTRSGSTATVAGIEPPVERDPGGSPSPLGRRVLKDPHIVLHGPAIADIRSGDTQDSILQVLLNLAEDHEFEVLTLHTGHPHNVYATDRTSNHTEGRAADIWRIDGRPVVRAPHDLLAQALTDAGAAGATEVGGPFDLNGGGPGYFTDEVHSDHLHVGITPDRPGLSA